VCCPASSGRHRRNQYRGSWRSNKFRNLTATDRRKSRRRQTGRGRWGRGQRTSRCQCQREPGQKSLCEFSCKMVQRILYEE
jgi:hypothetical protein